MYPNYSPHIIKSPELNLTAGRIPHRFAIDSSNRDNKYPRANSYTYNLGTEYKDVISIELVYGCIPRSEICDEKYVILKIGEAQIVESNDINLANSFAIIAFNVPLGDNQVINNAELPRNGNIKYYNPPLGKLSKLNIQFLTINGKLYDFNGKDHILVFEIITLNSPGLYNNIVPI